jgi:hypothetical protein
MKTLAKTWLWLVATAFVVGNGVVCYKEQEVFFTELTLLAAMFVGYLTIMAVHTLGEKSEDDEDY